MEAIIKLEYANQKKAEAIAKAVSPDNFTAPAGLHVETRIEKNNVTVQVVINKKIFDESTSINITN